MTKETWVQFAERIKPTDGQLFKDIRGKDWVYEARGHRFRLKSDAICRTDLHSDGAWRVPCVLIDPIAEEKKND